MNAPIQGCFGKTPYLSWEKANKALKRTRFREREGRGEVGVYRCRACQHWHIGHSSKLKG